MENRLPDLNRLPEWERKMFRAFWARLNKATDGCRPDMHEPDEQGVTAVVYGNDLDNAMGDKPVLLDSGDMELCVGIKRAGCDVEGVQPGDPDCSGSGC